jgi:chromate reductase, NAD(P)H dehydrogenase (quinone)
VRNNTFRLLGLCGSLRARSFNRAILRAAVEMLPEDVDYEEFDIGTLPHFNEDVQLQGEPASVQALKASIAVADALLIATPEYNYSIPGVLKNAIDWASRPKDTTPLRSKPVGIMGAGPGFTGTVRAQMALRTSFIFTGTYVMPAPEVFVREAPNKIDADGRLHDQESREHIRALVLALIAWAKQVGQRA